MPLRRSSGVHFLGQKVVERFNSNIGNGFTPQPIIAPKKVCTTFQNQYVEQPIICPIECRRVNNIVYVPRYYPRYEQTCYTQTNRY